MIKNKSWIYIMFGVYPLSLFNLGNSDLSILKQLLILIFIISIIAILINIGGILSMKYLILIMLVVLLPYIIGKLHRKGLFVD